MMRPAPVHVYATCLFCFFLGVLMSSTVRRDCGAVVRVTSAADNSKLPSLASFTTPIPSAQSGASYRMKHFSQAGQDKAVDSLLNGMSGGFFVESGAYDGVNLSNSLYFEASKGWKGLLVEANPYLYQKIINSSGRNASVIHACVSPTKHPEVLPFKLAGPLGGLVGEQTTQMQERITKEISAKEAWMQGAEGSGSTLDVNCWPLASMLKALGVNRVDFWSLDTEGSEAAILEATDFDSLDIRVILVEVNDAAAEAKVHKVMSRRSEYKLHKKLDFDLLYVKSAGI